MYELPITITVNENVYSIRNKGDYRMVLDVFTVLNDVELSEQERILTSLIIFYTEFDDVKRLFACSEEELTALTEEMFNFFNCGQTSPGANTNVKLIDWDNDEQLIASAINNVANTEIRSVEYCHWWTFMGYYCAIGESPLSTVVGIRSKIVKGKKLEKYEQEFRRDNPQYFNWDRRTLQEKEDDALLQELWNKR
jgi:hypothetical protein